MDVAGPSLRVPRRLQRQRRVETSYEEDLLGLVGQLSPDEINEYRELYDLRMQTGYRPSDYDVALTSLLQQAHELATINEDRILAQRIADEEDTE